jgi:hypothetical protein
MNCDMSPDAGGSPIPTGAFDGQRAILLVMLRQVQKSLDAFRHGATHLKAGLVLPICVGKSHQVGGRIPGGRLAHMSPHAVHAGRVNGKSAWLLKRESREIAAARSWTGN